MEEDVFGPKNKDPYHWFKNDPTVFESAVKAISAMLPEDKNNGVEITCGPDLFSKALGIPARPLACNGPGTDTGHFKLPFDNLCLDYVFVSYCDSPRSNLSEIFQEVFRTLKTSGTLVVAFIDAKSPSGQRYTPDWLCPSEYDREKIMFDLTHAGFKHFDFSQTLFSPPEEVAQTHPSKPGYGEGSFVVVLAKKKM